MSTDITVAVIALFGTGLGTFGGILASTKLMSYRIEQLEIKVDKHNNVIERTLALELTAGDTERRICNLEKEYIRKVYSNTEEG